MSQQPWGGVPPASFEFGLADHDGVLAFFVVGGLHMSVSTSFGERDAVRCSIVMLDGREAGKEFQDVLIFNSRPVARLRNVPGQIILARIGMAQGKGGNNAPVELYDATPQDNALATRYYQAFPNKLRELLEAVQYSFTVNERKAAQDGGRVRSEPHPTHAGSRTPANNFGQSQPPPPPAAPPWSQPEASAPPPDPWAQRNPTLASMTGGTPPPPPPDPWAQQQSPPPPPDPWAAPQPRNEPPF